LHQGSVIRKISHFCRRQRSDQIFRCFLRRMLLAMIPVLLLIFIDLRVLGWRIMGGYIISPKRRTLGVITLVIRLKIISTPLGRQQCLRARLIHRSGLAEMTGRMSLRGMRSGPKRGRGIKPTGNDFQQVLFRPSIPRSTRMHSHREEDLRGRGKRVRLLPQRDLGRVHGREAALAITKSLSFMRDFRQIALSRLR
jgi:hypothetical protein